MRSGVSVSRLSLALAAKQRCLLGPLCTGGVARADRHPLPESFGLAERMLDVK